ncbi:type II toxin-antitoxin system VapC family toxin [Rhodoblastus sp.]|uniref:type II toxin-antitoxin system VapC family toxin n=1 Tax=Rhodoblastus sp. TaxID=1962975 RepID=UPI003F9B9726
MTEWRTGPLAYLDANIFIELIEGTPELVAAASGLLRVADGREEFFATSELTLAEVLAGPKISAHERRLYMNLIAWNPVVRLVPITCEILIETADLRKFTAHKLPDAIHVVTALRQKCRFLVSRDRDMRKLPVGGMTYLQTGPEAIKALIEALNAG